MYPPERDFFSYIFLEQRGDLLKPIYKKTASYGHFGRDESEYTWEKIDKSEIIKNL